MPGQRLPESPPFPWPAIGAWGAISAGFLLARSYQSIDSAWWLVASMAAAAAAMALQGRRALPALAVAGILGGAGYFSWRLLDPPDSSTALLQPDLDSAQGLRERRAIMTFEGIVRSHPEAASASLGAFASFIHLPPITKFQLHAERVMDGRGERAVSGVVYVSAPGESLELKAGDRVRVTGFVSLFRAPSNPGAMDSRLWARQNGALGRLRVETRQSIEKLPDSERVSARLKSRMWRARADLRAVAAAWLDTTTSHELSDQPASSRAVVAALLLGAREDASMHELTSAMRRIGVAHVLAISGMHLGVLVFFAVLGLRVIGVRAGAELLIVAAVVLLYMTLVPARTPIIRAGVMSLAFLAAEAIGRRYHPLSILAWTGVAVLIWRPLDLWSPGYQLSFGVVAAIVTFPKHIQRRLHPLKFEPDALTRRQWLKHRFEQMLIVGGCAWIVATPVAMYHFGILSLFGAVASILLFPFVLVVIGAGAAALVLASLAPSAASFFGDIVMAAGDVLVRVTLVIDALPLTSLHTPPVSLWWVLFTIPLATWLIMKPSPYTRRDVGVAALLIVWLGGFAFEPRLERDVALRIDAIDVDDGSCILIRSGRDAVLWDAGSQRLWMSEWALPSAMRALEAWPVRRIVLSHPNLDHYSAILDLAAPLGVREVLVEQATIRQAEFEPSGPVAFLLNRLERMGVEVRVIAAGDTLRIGESVMEFLHPTPGEEYAASNDSSLTAIVRTPTSGGVRTALFCGDIERSAIAAIRRAYPHLRADIMEAPHHGSARREAMAFVREVDPRVVIQSTGPSRADDDRWDDTRAGRHWFTTATDGWISVIVRTSGVIETSSVARPDRIISASETATNTAQ